MDLVILLNFFSLHLNIIETGFHNWDKGVLIKVDGKIFDELNLTQIVYEILIELIWPDIAEHIFLFPRSGLSKFLRIVVQLLEALELVSSNVGDDLGGVLVSLDLNQSTETRVPC